VSHAQPDVSTDVLQLPCCLLLFCHSLSIFTANVHGICLLCVQADEQATVDPLAPKAKTNHKKTKTPLPSAQEDGTCPATHQVAAAKPQAPPAPTALSIATAAPAADDHGAAGTSEIEDDPVPDQQQQAVAVDVAQSFGADIGMKTPSPPATADGPHETQ